MQSTEYLKLIERRVVFIENNIKEIVDKLERSSEIGGYERNLLDLLANAGQKADRAKRSIMAGEDRPAIELAAGELKDAFNSVKRVLH